MFSKPKRFGPLTTQEGIQCIQKSAVPLNTQKNTAWATTVWIDWTEYRKGEANTSEEYPSPLIHRMSKEELGKWLPHFVLEIRNKNGDPYPPNTLYQLCCGLLRQIRTTNPSWNIFEEPAFTDFQKCLDGVMKKLKADGLGNSKRQAEPISFEEEDYLWSSRQLGMHCPQALVDTLFYLVGICFGLRGGQEQRQLRWNPPQLSVVEPPDGRKYLQYIEDISKNNCGGLKMRKLEAKKVIQHENLEHPDKCIVRIFNEYCCRCPQNRPENSFYLKPLTKPKGEVWFSTVAIGHNTLDKTISRICKNAGIAGYKTNHSLRVSLATRLFQKGIEEQLIMAKTGHRSTEGIRNYKRVSKEQLTDLSDAVACSSAIPKPKLPRFEPQGKENQSPMVSFPTNPQQTGIFSFSNCGNVTITFGKLQDNK